MFVASACWVQLHLKRIFVARRIVRIGIIRKFWRLTPNLYIFGGMDNNSCSLDNI